MPTWCPHPGRAAPKHPRPLASPGLGLLWGKRGRGGSRSPGPPDRPRISGKGLRPSERGCAGRAAGRSDLEGAGGKSGQRRSGGRGAVPVAAPLVCGRAPRAMATVPPAPHSRAAPGAVRTSPPTGGGAHQRARTHGHAHSGRPRAPGGEPEAPGALGPPCPRPPAYGRVPRCSSVSPPGWGWWGECT